MMTRAASFSPSTINEKTRTVEMIFSTGARVRRSNYVDGTFDEELSMDPAHVRMGRLNSGAAPFLAEHNSRELAAVIGVIESARIENGKGIAVVRFAKGDPAADAAWNKVSQGILRNVSVGYKVMKTEKTETTDGSVPVFRVIDWEPHEVSLVPIGADADATFRNTPTPTPNQEKKMTIQNQDIQRERERVSAIRAAARVGGLDEVQISRMIDDGTPADQARAFVLEQLANRSDAIRIEPHVTTEVGEESNAISQRIRLQAEALAYRAGGAPPSNDARQYQHFTLVDHARHLIEARGMNASRMSNNEVLKHSLRPSFTRGGTGYATTSDFTALLTSTGDRQLLEGYKTFSGGLKPLARKSSARDFRAKSFLKLSEAPELLPKNEHGEIKSGAMTESAASYSVKTVARIFSLTREALVNDDLSAFDIVKKFGQSAAEYEAKTLAALVSSNPVMADGYNVFSTQHANLAATPAVISVASLGIAMKTMRLQFGLDGKTPLDVMPKYLVVPAALEMLARQQVATFWNGTRAETQPFKFEVIVDPRLDAASATAWYVMSDTLPGLEYSYLDGQDGPAITTTEGFEIEGTRFRVVLDFGCGVIEHRGLFKNAGV